jgi:hypothetical protein
MLASQEISTIEKRPDIDPAVTAHAEAIRALGKRAIANIIEIGRRLTECKTILGHGNWLRWLEHEFGWSDETARRFIRVEEMAKSHNLLNLDFPVSALYLLAAPSTPAEVRDEILDRAKNGEKVTHAEVKCVVADAKPTPPQAARAAGSAPKHSSSGSTTTGTHKAAVRQIIDIATQVIKLDAAKVAKEFQQSFTNGDAADLVNKVRSWLDRLAREIG